VHLVGFIIRVYLLVRAHYFLNVVKVSSQQHSHILLPIPYKHQSNLKIFCTLETLRFTIDVELKIQAQTLPFSLTKGDRYYDKTKPKVTRYRAFQYLELADCIGPSVGLLIKIKCGSCPHSDDSGESDIEHFGMNRRFIGAFVCSILCALIKLINGGKVLTLI